ncbi:MAG: hypothetical protein A3F33_03740 [Candidatus Woykebacteria bacterium RIFCSPHIGHO2_12_FULL_43_10]|uniref:Uncharacterized protein n=2 Tax=Candidatus Woykeibacteriota TaxID=1817899 RepID=A0A1G1WVE4_9BACT|nr:MAG: hypothetical protein A2802_01220 [Candidatus Woykebacteria bacterium RIFCSPHIGHO2_01_FULL_43_29]OGY28988.1 MAG: hypothetical protein A3J50_03815 [Candidatus Woykebacteria bacterium RIFCSPHIGHO2_02_FULL_43_16b]OGY30353.1 MAG: hypothetical protein A3F33_03740 [Candidatus Woykebacteria bacterium RIFCSPHIGHO2_12_FULL_43_10]OGY31310.1 MAG: hypothetical protein A3A61_02875 [Candidatus Woykebacteria bacterium RIFCSPLOWO2_01_FULL_43_14]
MFFVKSEVSKKVSTGIEITKTKMIIRIVKIYQNWCRIETMSAFLSWIKTNWFVLSILSGLVIISYVNTLTNQFVSDDRSIVLEGPNWGLEDVYNRAHYSLRLLVYLITYKLVGLNPVLYHISNILFHIANVVLVYEVVKKLSKPKIAFFTAALFSVHPILSESIAWVSGGGYAQYTFFFLISFLLFINAKNNWKMILISTIFLTLSILSSEKALPLILVYVLYEICYGSIIKRWRYLVPFLVIGIIFGIYFVSLLTNRSVSLQTSYYQEGGYYNPLIQIPTALSKYLELIFWPMDLTLYQTELNFPPLIFGIRALVTLALFGFIIWSFFKNKSVFFGLSFFLITLLPTLTPLKIASVVAERYVYLGSIGIFFVVSFLLYKLFNKKKLKFLSYAIFGLAIVLLSFRTMVRNLDWENEDTLWLSAAKTSPSSPHNHNNLADYYARHGDYQNAIRELLIAIALVPNYADAYHNLGNTYKQIGNTEESINSYEQAIKYNPGLWQSYQNLGAVYFDLKKLDLAKANFLKALEINPSNPQIQQALQIVEQSRQQSF